MTYYSFLTYGSLVVSRSFNGYLIIDISFVQLGIFKKTR